MDHHAGMWRQRTALALGAGHQQERTPCWRPCPCTASRHVGLDPLHRVVDRQACADAAAGRVDVQEDVLVGVLALEKQQLRHHQVGGGVVDRPDQEDDALSEQPAVDVVGAFAATRLLDHHGHEPQGLDVLNAHESCLFRRSLGDVGGLWACKCRPVGPEMAPGHGPVQLPTISSSNGTVLSTTLASPSTWAVTLFSTTTASTSAMRSRLPRYQRTTSAGFS